jgi:galactose mutarotase-like enzyme
VLCWDIPASGRKAKINKTQKPYKFTLSTDEYQVHIYVIKYMDGIKVLSRTDLEKRGIKI